MSSDWKYGCDYCNAKIQTSEMHTNGGDPSNEITSFQGIERVFDINAAALFESVASIHLTDTLWVITMAAKQQQIAIRVEAQTAEQLRARSAVENRFVNAIVEEAIRE